MAVPLLVAAALCLSSLLARPGPSAAAAPFVIGAIVSLTGSNAIYGQSEYSGMMIAVNEINKSGGIDGRPVSLIAVGDSDGAGAAARTLADQNNAMAIVGRRIPAELNGVGVPLVSFVSPVSRSADPADPWLFTIGIRETDLDSLVSRNLNATGQQNVAFVSPNDAFGNTTYATFLRDANEGGIAVKYHAAIPLSTTDVTPFVVRIKEVTPDAVVVRTAPEFAGPFITNYRQAGASTPIYYVNTAARRLLQSIGPNTHNVFVATTKFNVAAELPAGDPQKSVIDAYLTSFRTAKASGDPFNAGTGFGYDSIKLIKAAAERVHAKNGKELRDALESTSYVGVTGIFRFSQSDHNGLSIEAIVLAEVVDRTFVLHCNPLHCPKSPSK